MKIYRGVANANGCVVYVDDGNDSYPLPPCLGIRNHSPTGFAWGYHGSGPAQLALALLVDHLGGENKPEAVATAAALYQQFKADEIAALPAKFTWVMSTNHIQGWLDRQRAGGQEATA